ncbi:MAG: DNA alkylation repair protein [Chitinophagales bacterium]
MTTNEIITILEEHKDEKGIRHWKKHGNSSISSYGIGISKLRKLISTYGIKRNRYLAHKLWKTPIAEAQLMSTLVDEPQKLTKARINQRMEESKYGMLSHYFAINVVIKTSYVREMINKWVSNENTVYRRSGYALLGELAKPKTKAGQHVADEYFAAYLNIIDREIWNNEGWTQDAMNNCLIAIGQRSQELNDMALEIATKIGKLNIDYGDTSCKTLDTLRYLNKAKEKLAEKVGNI